MSLVKISLYDLDVATYCSPSSSGSNKLACFLLNFFENGT